MFKPCAFGRTTIMNGALLNRIKKTGDTWSFRRAFSHFYPPTLHVGGFQPLQKAIHPTLCKPCSGRKLLTVDSPVLPPLLHLDSPSSVVYVPALLSRHVTLFPFRGLLLPGRPLRPSRFLSASEPRHSLSRSATALPWGSATLSSSRTVRPVIRGR